MLRNKDVDFTKLVTELAAVENALRSDEESSASNDGLREARLAADNHDYDALDSALRNVTPTALTKAAELGLNAAIEAIRSRMPMIASAQELAHISPWAQLGHKKYLVETNEINALVPNRIWENLEQYGICLIRLNNYPAEATVLESIVKLVGFPTEDQNDYSGSIKDITPAATGRPNSGDTTSELGFHVDGTQERIQPALLAFQYVRGAKLGANSKFIDMAGVLSDLKPDEMYEVLTKLSRSDAASFSKLDVSYRGPIFSFSATGALACRIRFDSVIDIHPECRTAFELLRAYCESTYYPSMFLPEDGDVIVFDNWRVMHARDEIHGPIQRHHRRVWIGLPRHEHQIDYKLGIRPITPQLQATIEANSLGQSPAK